MDHNDIRHKLSEYLDGSVTPDEKAAIEGHLPTCAECSDALRELRKTIDHLHAVEEVQPPAWMAQKIMAKVREEREAKHRVWHRLFYPLAVKLPIQALAMLFLTVTVYYIYSSMHPADKYAEAPVGRIAQEETRPGVVVQKEQVLSAPREKKQEQAPGYRSLDMRYSYEKPAPPAPAGQPAEAPAAVAGKRSEPLPAKDEAAPAVRQAAPKAAAPAMMAEQAAPAAGAARPSEAEQALAQKTRSSSSRDLDAEAVLDVSEHFAKYDLPDKMKVKGLRYAVRKYERGLADLSWMEGMAAYRSNPCASRYVVDVDLSGSLSKYLYCYDNRIARLLGIFELRNGKWLEIK